MKPMREIFREYGVVENGVHVNGTDKETNHHYGDVYERLIPNREEVKLMMEIGIADGSSLLAWRDIFPNAICVGLDFHHSDKAHGDRIEFYLGDQRNRQDCEIAASGRKFDLIVEDASHELRSILVTLYWLWPYIKPGGMYVVEEWDGVVGSRGRIQELWPNAEVTQSDEPLVVFRKPK
jgi:cephalosporin hydroxylase